MSCLAELRGLGAVYEDLERLGVRLVAVSVDPPRQSRDVVRRGQLPFSILSDEQRTVTRALGLVHRGGGPDGSDIALPAHLLLDRTRRVRWRYVADRIQNRLSPETVLENVRTVLENEAP